MSGYRPAVEVIAKEQYETQKNIQFLDKILKKSKDSVNPNPILGTEKASQLLNDLEQKREPQIHQVPYQPQGTTFYAKINKKHQRMVSGSDYNDYNYNQDQYQNKKSSDISSGKPVMIPSNASGFSTLENHPHGDTQNIFKHITHHQINQNSGVGTVLENSQQDIYEQDFDQQTIGSKIMNYDPAQRTNYILNKNSVDNWTAQSSKIGIRLKPSSMSGYQPGDSQSPFSQPPYFEDQRGSQSIRVNLEKREIDKFLKEVRRQKRSNLFVNPNVKYEHRFKTPQRQSPMSVWGIKKHGFPENQSQVNIDLPKIGKTFGKRSESLQFAFGSGAKPQLNAHEQHMENQTTAAGVSLKTIKETPSTQMNGLNHDLILMSQQLSQTLDISRRQSMPRVKLVQVSPKLSLRNFKGLQSARNITSTISKPNWVIGNLQSHIQSIQRLIPVDPHDFSVLDPSAPHSENFYQAIEQLPLVPLSVKFQVKDQMADMERQIRAKRKRNMEIEAKNEKLREEFKEQFERKKKLKKAAKEILILERAQDKAKKEREAREMGLEVTNDEKESPERPGRKKEQEQVVPRTKEELQGLEKLAETETRIYKLYRDYAVNDLKREKQAAVQAIKAIRQEKNAYKQQLQLLKEENDHLTSTVQRYQTMIKNFDREYKSQQVFLTLQKQEKSHQRKTARMNKSIIRINEGEIGGSPDVHRRVKANEFELIINNLPNSKEDQRRKSQMSQMSPEKPRREDTPTMQSSKSSANLEKISVIEVEKMMDAFKLVLKYEKPTEMALAMLDGIQSIFGCQKVTMYPLDYYVAKQTTENIHKDRKDCIQSISFQDESENVPTVLRAICKSKVQLCTQLIFKTVRSFYENILIDNNGQRMGIIIKQCQGKVPGPSFIIQAEFEDQANQTKSKKDQNSQLVNRSFNYTQAMIVQLFCLNVQLKFEKLRLQLTLRGKKNEVADSIALVGRITKARTLKALMRSYLHEIPKFFGFKDVSIMFHDEEQQQLYTITQGDDEDAKVQYEKQRKSTKDEDKIDYINAMEKMRDNMLSGNQMIQFPVSTGITSMVFKSQKTMFFNNFNPKNNIYFSNDIDNIQSIEKIDNIMIGALKRENGTTNGIIQLYNCPNPILPKDTKKFDAISRFFGQNIQNMEDLTKKLTQTLAVTLESQPTNLKVSESVEIIDESRQNWDQISKPVQNMELIIQQSMAVADKLEQEINSFNVPNEIILQK